MRVRIREEYKRGDFLVTKEGKAYQIILVSNTKGEDYLDILNLHTGQTLGFRVGIYETDKLIEIFKSRFSGVQKVKVEEMTFTV